MKAHSIISVRIRIEVAQNTSRSIYCELIQYTTHGCDTTYASFFNQNRHIFTLAPTPPPFCDDRELLQALRESLQERNLTLVEIEPATHRVC